MVFPDRQKKPIRFFPVAVLGWTLQNFSLLLFRLSPHSPTLYSLEIFLVDYVQIVCIVVMCSVCWKSITLLPPLSRIIIRYPLKLNKPIRIITKEENHSISMTTPEVTMKA